MTNYVYVAESLDGYIADKNRSVEWLNEFNKKAEEENSDLGFADFMEKIDVIIMGSNTFREILALDLWPYTKPVCVLSSKKDIVPEHLKDKAFRKSGNVLEIYKELKDKGNTSFYIDGAFVIQNFLQEGLIDEMYITTVPTLLGGGISLFRNLGSKVDFKIVGSELLCNSLVKNHYVRKDS